MKSESIVHATVENVARGSYGKLLAYLAARSRDVASCEEALADAFEAALEKWQDEGIPENPEGWLFMVAKNKLIDSQRRGQRSLNFIERLIVSEVDRREQNSEAPVFQDNRLKLLFVCCHPAIDSTIRTPLMLQTVLGLKSETIASAFLTSPSAMMKKLVRAKQKIKLAGIAFAVPGPEELPERVEFVAEAIYAAYGKSWDALGSSDSELTNLDEEALYLSDLLVQLLPEEPEPKGLLALILHCEARKIARRSEANVYVPLDAQDPKQWNFSQISKAEEWLSEAFALGKMGRFQLEAAIQSAHSSRVGQKTNHWAQIILLYDGLISMAPTVGAFVGRAGAVMEHLGAEEAERAILRLPGELVATYQPYWALRAEILSRLGKVSDAVAAYDTAIGLSQDASVKRFLKGKKDALGL